MISSVINQLCLSIANQLPYSKKVPAVKQEPFLLPVIVKSPRKALRKTLPETDPTLRIYLAIFHRRLGISRILQEHALFQVFIRTEVGSHPHGLIEIQHD